MCSLFNSLPGKTLFLGVIILGLTGPSPDPELGLTTFFGIIFWPVGFTFVVRMFSTGMNQEETICSLKRFMFCRLVLTISQYLFMGESVPRCRLQGRFVQTVIFVSALLLFRLIRSGVVGVNCSGIQPARSRF